jgi:dolichyl-phosphate-mannose-protein mannosyltransferase
LLCRYADERGSSHQQQVSCYTYKDVNNWWIIKRPDREDLVVQEPIDSIKHGDVVQLVHGLSHRALNSHDVAAPMSPNNQEVSCYIDYNISMAAENLWTVDIVNRESAGDVWHTINSQVRLIHVNTSAALRYTGKSYPEWGFHQAEVVTDRNIHQADSVWNVEEHRYTTNDKDKDTIVNELNSHELIPESKTMLSFWQKFFELQIKMLSTNQENVKNHNFASDPLEWPFLTRGIAYYIAKDSNNQVHLMGNIVLWYTASVCGVLYAALLVFYLLRRRRLCFDIAEAEFRTYCQAGEVLLTGYLVHYVPFFFYDRTLFLHHYLPAYLYKLMLAAYFLSHCSYHLRLVG